MKLQKTIQKQIDDIMDSYEFDRCAKLLKFLKKSGNPYPSTFFDGKNPCVATMRQEARKFMERAGYEITKKGIKYAFCSSGYFKATAVRAKDDDGKWVRMDLHFGIDSFNDGEAYDD